MKLVKTAAVLLMIMNAQAQNNITWVDMSLFVSGTAEERKEVAQRFGQALRETGFVAVSNCGINPETVDNAYKAMREFFTLPDGSKLNYFMSNGWQGFVPFGTEHAKYTSIPDLKEFYQFTRQQPENLIPREVEHFKQAITALHQELEDCLRSCLRATALYLGYEGTQETILADLLATGNMRLIHYPALDDTMAAGAVRSAAHEDISLMTVIPCPTQPGLQVLTPAIR